MFLFSLLFVLHQCGSTLCMPDDDRILVFVFSYNSIESELAIGRSFFLESQNWD
jgi:hypothetical protein